ncbi:MAG TPA: hypothetical protein VFQ54_10495, partial [Thermomicrobiales bacterium]|nr:hypothetical protein [Thermomicrobiales bacterium]
ISLASESTTMVPELKDAASRLFDEEINGVADLLDSGRPVSSDEISRFGWSLTRSGGDFPVLNGSVDDDSDHVSIPTSAWWNDYAWWNPTAPQPPSSFLETLSTSLQSVRTIGGLMTLVVHPHISGRPGFADTIVRFADEAIGAGDVWIPTATDLADWWRQRQFRAE